MCEGGLFGLCALFPIPDLSFPPPDKLVGKRKRHEGEEAVEMVENTDNPLRCPVRLYEFYLSKW